MTEIEEEISDILAKDCRRKVYIEKGISFAADYIDMQKKGRTIFCSLGGEYLRDGKSFDPPLDYSIVNMQVVTEDLREILAPAYYGLIGEEEKKVNESRIGFRV